MTFDFQSSNAFLAHLSTMCSGWAIVTGLCPSLCVVRQLFSSPKHKVLRVSYCDRSLPVVVLRPSCVNIFTLTSSPLKPLIGFWPNYTGMVPGRSPIKVVQMVLISCISRSQCNFQISSCPKLQGPERSYLVYSII